MNTNKLKALAYIEVLCLEEDTSPHDSFDDEALAQQVLDDLHKGNPWAWCCVEVRASFAGLEGSAFLGACSYASEQAFRTCPYFEDKVEEALGYLQEQLEETAKLIEQVL